MQSLENVYEELSIVVKCKKYKTSVIDILSSHILFPSFSNDKKIEISLTISRSETKRHNFYKETLITSFVFVSIIEQISLLLTPKAGD